MLKFTLFTLFSVAVSASSLFAVNSSTHIESDSQKIIQTKQQPKSSQPDKSLNDKMMFEKFQKLNQPPKAVPQNTKNKNIILDIQTPHGGVTETKITNDTGLKTQQPNHLKILNFEPEKTVNESSQPTQRQPQNIQNQQPPPYNPQNVEQRQENRGEIQQRPYEHSQVQEVRPTQPQQEQRTSKQPEQKPNDVFINK